MASPHHGGENWQPGGLQKDATELCLVGVEEHMRRSTWIGLEGCILGGREERKGVPVEENSMTESSEVLRTSRCRMDESRARILESNYIGLNPGSITYSCGP